MNKYDVLCMFDPKVDETKIETILKKLEAKITAAGGKIAKTEKKGTRPLASQIQKRKELKEVNYINLVVEGPGAVPAEINKLLRVTEEVVRFMVSVKTEEEILAKGQSPAKPAAEEEKVEISPSIFVGEGEPGGQS
ncbi:MAG: 30S ribosomal protein S6 [Candidatus Margulisiibacteriota bacterium]